MANTIPDIKLVNTSYTNLYTVTGIPTATPLVIQNKQTTGIYIQISPTQPIASSRDGWLLAGNDAVLVEGGNISNVWAWGTSTISVQIYD